jgi:dihydroxyacetone kinase-like predicted kinase
VGSVKRGQPLAIADGDVLAVTRRPLEALEHVCVALDVVDAEIVTLLVGGDVDEDERAGAVGVIAELTEAELDVIDAGLRPSRYWIGVE